MDVSNTGSIFIRDIVFNIFGFVAGLVFLIHLLFDKTYELLQFEHIPVFVLHFKQLLTHLIMFWFSFVLIIFVGDIVKGIVVIIVVKAIKGIVELWFSISSLLFPTIKSSFILLYEVSL